MADSTLTYVTSICTRLQSTQVPHVLCNNRTTTWPLSVHAGRCNLLHLLCPAVSIITSLQLETWHYCQWKQKSNTSTMIAATLYQQWASPTAGTDSQHMGAPPAVGTYSQHMGPPPYTQHMGRRHQQHYIVCLDLINTAYKLNSNIGYE